MMYLLDTCVISDFARGDHETLKHIKHTPPSQVATSSITIMEIEFGLALNPSRAKKLLPVFHDFFQVITVLSFNLTAARHAANIRANLQKQGKPIGAYDILIAGVALNHNLTLVTSNTKEFERIPQLTLENWRLS